MSQTRDVLQEIKQDADANKLHAQSGDLVALIEMQTNNAELFATIINQQDIKTNSTPLANAGISLEVHNWSNRRLISHIMRDNTSLS